MRQTLNLAQGLFWTVLLEQSRAALSGPYRRPVAFFCRTELNPLRLQTPISKTELPLIRPAPYPCLISGLGGRV